MSNSLTPPSLLHVMKRNPLQESQLSKSLEREISRTQKQIEMTALPGGVIYIYGVGDSILDLGIGCICAKADTWFIQALQPQIDADPPSQPVKLESQANANKLNPFHALLGQEHS